MWSLFLLLYSLTVPARKIHSCFTTCVIRCVNYSCLNLDVKAVVLLQLVLQMQAHPFAVQVEPTMFQTCLRPDTSFVWPFDDSTCLWRVLFMSRIKPVTQNLFAYFKICFRLWNMPIGKIGNLWRYFLWDRCLVYTLYRNVRCCGSIPIATEDWLTHRLQARQLLWQVG